MTFLPLYPRVSCKFDGKAIFDESRTVHVTFRAGKLQKFVPNAHFNQTLTFSVFSFLHEPRRIKLSRKIYMHV